MKNLVKAILLISLVVLSTTMIATANAVTWPTLPSTPVSMSVVAGSASYLDVTLSSVQSGYSVSNGLYPGWCVDWNYYIEAGRNYEVYLFNTLGASLPASVASINWNAINYILNHKQGTTDQVQAAIWYFTNNISPASTNTAAWAMINTAKTKPAYQPNPGETLGILCLTADWVTSLPPFSTQPILIEIQIPHNGPPSGLTPGFWKNKVSLWQGSSPTDSFNTVFGVSIKIGSNTNPTLLQAINAGGGGVIALARHAVAALLNAQHQYMNYPLTSNQVIELVRNAISSGNSATIEAAKNQLEAFNSLEGGIDAHGNPIV
jgi:hypothetical protein